MSLLLDIGSVGNLSGDSWVQEMAKLALKHHRKPEQYQRDRPLSVSGVGNGSQRCQYNVKLPVAIPTTEGSVVGGKYDTPTVEKSMLPALLGLDAVRRLRGIIDTNTLKIYMCGPSEYDLAAALPSGTDCVQCQIAPSGHMVIPCGDFTTLDQAERTGGLTIDREVALPVRSRSVSPRETPDTQK